MTTSFISRSYALINTNVLSFDNKQAIEIALKQGRALSRSECSCDAEFNALCILCGKLAGFIFRHYS